MFSCDVEQSNPPIVEAVRYVPFILGRGNDDCIAKTSKSFVCNARPSCFQISGGILSTPAVLALFLCSMALVVSLMVGKLSSSVFTACQGMQKISDSRTVRLALKKS